MIKQLRKVGNSTALLLDKPILELMGITDCAKVQLIVTNGALVVTAVDPQPVSEEEFQANLDRVVSDWGDVLKRLA